MHNLDKILHYILFFTKGPIEVDGVIKERKKSGIRLASTFFHSDDCIQCGRCCIGEDHVYVEHEYKHIVDCTKQEFDAEDLPVDRLYELQANTFPEHHTVNGKDVIVYVHKCPKTEMYIPAKGRVKETCNWLFEDRGLYRCGIHPVSSMTCDLPHTRMFHQKEGTVSIGTSQYGRNWAMGCPIEFHEPMNQQEFDGIKARRIFKLKRILNCATDMNILDTYLPDVIQFIESITYEYYKHALGYDFIRIKPSSVEIDKEFVPAKKAIKLVDA